MAFCSQCGSTIQPGSSFCTGCGKASGPSVETHTSTTGGAASSEREFYNTAGVLVTNARFVVGPQTFTMGGVTSVTPFTEPPSYKGPGIVIVLGILAALGGCAQNAQGQGWGGIVAGLVIVALGVWWLSRRKPTYHVLLRTASGEAKPLNSQDANYIGQVVNALNEAIVYRR